MRRAVSVDINVLVTYDDGTSEQIDAGSSERSGPACPTIEQLQVTCKDKLERVEALGIDELRSSVVIEWVAR